MGLLNSLGEEGRGGGGQRWQSVSWFSLPSARKRKDSHWRKKKDEKYFFSLELTEAFVTRRFAGSLRHLTIPRFTDCGWSELYPKYWSVFVDFFYSLVVGRPSGSFETAVSRKVS